MSELMDALRAHLDPARWLQDARATGAEVSVCLVDTGVDRAALQARHPGLRDVEGGIFGAHRAEPAPYAGAQSAPHGTTVADILLTLAPQVRLYSADVFGPSGTCEVEVVVKAIRWAVDVWKCNVINLSLGVAEQRLQPLPRRAQLFHAIEHAYFRDVLVVAAAHNDHPLTRSYPAHFSPLVLAVDKGQFDEPLRLAYALREQIEFQARGRGYLGPFAQEPATSWAAAHLTGIAARLLSLHPGLKPFEVKTLLYWMSQRKEQA